MPKEYRTIREVAGPLMMISDVDNVKFNELGEIELPSGETRRCRVLEVDGSNALVQLFESAAGINLANSQGALSGAVDGAGRCRRICSAACSTGSDGRSTAARRLSRKSGWMSTARR